MDFFYLETDDFVLKTLFDALPLLRDVFDSLAQHFKQAWFTESTESSVIVPNTIHLGLTANHVVEAFL